MRAITIASGLVVLAATCLAAPSPQFDLNPLDPLGKDFWENPCANAVRCCIDCEQRMIKNSYYHVNFTFHSCGQKFGDHLQRDWERDIAAPAKAEGYKTSENIDGNFSVEFNINKTMAETLQKRLQYDGREWHKFTHGCREVGPVADEDLTIGHSGPNNGGLTGMLGSLDTELKTEMFNS